MIPSNISCSQCQEHLPLYVAGTLPHATQVVVERHLATCDNCQRLLAQWRMMQAGIRWELADMPPALPLAQSWERIQAQLSAFAPQASLGGKEMRNISQATISTSARVHQHRGRSVWVSGLCVLLIAALAFALFSLRHPGNIPGQTVPAPIFVGAGELNLVSMAGPNDGWALGETYVGCPVSSGQVETILAQPMVYRYQGGKWTKLPTIVTSEQSAVQLSWLHMLGPSDGWAVGARQDPSTAHCPSTTAPVNSPTPLLLHFDGKQWSVVQTIPMVAVDVAQVMSDQDIWVGYTNTMLHYNGATWETFTLPKEITSLSGLAFTSATEGWAVADDGVSYPPKAAFLAYHAGQWKIQQIVENNQIFHVAMLSAQDGLAAVSNSATQSIWRFRDGRWAASATPFAPSAGIFQRLAAQNGQLWSLRQFAFPLQPTLDSFDGTKWQSAPVEHLGTYSTVTIEDISFVTPQEAWAVGTLQSDTLVKGQDNHQILLLHYLNGHWYTYGQ